MVLSDPVSSNRGMISFSNETCKRANAARQLIWNFIVDWNLIKPGKRVSNEFLTLRTYSITIEYLIIVAIKLKMRANFFGNIKTNQAIAQLSVQSRNLQFRKFTRRCTSAQIIARHLRLEC